MIDIETLGKLVEVIRNMNNAAEEEDCKRGYCGLCVIVFDDGSGQIGTWAVGHFSPQTSFDSLEELRDWLDKWVE